VVKNWVWLRQLKCRNGAANQVFRWTFLCDDPKLEAVIQKNKNLWVKDLWVSWKNPFLCIRFQQQGFLAEWLGTALQKLLQRFESVGNLQKLTANSLIFRKLAVFY
jgi:hypothetical protein